MAWMRYQPQGAIRLGLSPLARRLVSYLPLSGQVRDAVGGAWAIINGTTPLAFGGAPRGQGMRAISASTPSYVSRLQPTAIGNGTTQPMAMFYRLFVVAMPGNGVVSGLVQWADTATSGSPRLFARLTGSTGGAGVLEAYIGGAYRFQAPMQAGVEYIVFHTFDGTTHTLYLNGVLSGTPAVTAWGGNPGSFYLGRGFNEPLNPYILSDFGLMAECPSIAEIRAFSANPWMLFDAPEDDEYIVAASAPTNSTGTFAATLAAPSMASAGLVTAPGALAASMAAPIFAASGIAATPPSGTFAASMPAPVMTSAGTVLDAGQFSTTMPAPSMSAIGTAAPNATGTLTITMPAPTMSAFGFLGTSAPAAPVRPYRWRILRRGFAST